MTSYKTAVLTASTLVLLIACNAGQPLVVQDPDVATPGSLTGAQSLPAYRAGVLADFAVAFVGAGDQANGGHEGIADFGGLLTDELTDIETFPTRQLLNSRNAQASNGSTAGVFQNLGQAHNDARHALDVYAAFGPTQVGRAEVYAIDAYIYILVAEHFCSGEPFSLIDVATGAIKNGPFLTTTQMLDTAIAELQQATQIAGTDTVKSHKALVAQITGLAQVGTARALLDQGQVAAAATAASSVPVGLSYQIFESTNSLRQRTACGTTTSTSRRSARVTTRT
jgi:hypothetical protein